DDPNDDDEPEEHVHPDAREEYQVGTEYTGDGAGCSHGWDRGCWSYQDVRGGGHETAEQVEDQELHPAHCVFHVVPEDPEEEAVAQQVSPPSVEEHRRQRSESIDRIVVHHARHSGSERHRLTERGQPRQLTRNHPEVAYTRGQPHEPGVTKVERSLREHPDGE